jgi:tyrosyl-tRNA synthetase
VRQFHGTEAADRAEEDFRRAFSRGEVPDDVETRSLPATGGAPAAKTLVALGLAASMREARRKIAEGALRVYVDGTDAPREIRDPEEDLSAGGGGVLRLGRRFIRVAWTR